MEIKMTEEELVEEYEESTEIYRQPRKEGGCIMTELEELYDAEERADRVKHDEKLKELREEQLKAEKEVIENE